MTNFSTVKAAPLAALTIVLTLSLVPDAGARAQTGGAADPVLDRKSSGSVAAPERRVLAPGDPPLTEAMASRFGEFVAWLYDFPLTPADRDKFRAVLIADWQKGDRDAIAANLDMLRTADEVAKHGPAKRELFRRRIQPELVADARKKASGDADMRWLLSRHEEAHRPLATGRPGDPPLTRAAVNAVSEMVCFMMSQARGRKIEPTAEFKENTAKTLIDGYAKLDTAGRRELAQMPRQWAELRASWDTVSDAERERVRAGWRAQFGTGEPPAGAQGSVALAPDAAGQGAPRWTPEERGAQKAWADAVWATKDNELIPVPRTAKLLEEAEQAEKSAAEYRAKADQHNMAAFYDRKAQELRTLAATPPEKRPRMTRGKLMSLRMDRIPAAYQTAYYWIANHDMHELSQALTSEHNKHLGNMSILSSRVFFR
jgi:hypothetical protein